MSATSLNCRLMCASGAAYGIDTSQTDGRYNPLFLPGTTIINPEKTIYEKQYNAIDIKGKPFIITTGQIEAAMVCHTTDDLIFVVFRGTLAPGLNPDSVADWIQDIMAKPVADQYLPGLVHEGFLLATKLLVSGIVSAIEQLDPAHNMPVYVTGHSKGGGMAPIASLYLKNAFGLKITQTVTFAGPQPGNVDFCTAYDGIFTNTLRYQNYLDIVPLLPPTADFVKDLEDIPILKYLGDLLNAAIGWDYGSVGNLQYIDANGNVAIIPTPMDLRLAEIVEKLVTGQSPDIIAAHHSECGYGYMNGACDGNVCN